jgi:potassium efflux system protein
MTFSYIGIAWSNIQWLVAALSVGLGFGLQEIVANFISGIILLFERPIRAGDLVTVGDVTGRVSKINIRATTIITFDRQELLVPNKEFITAKVLNWTLSNNTNRVTIEVGIAYDSDVEQAMELLKEAASDASKVLDDPEPIISFDIFGDSSLILKARCYINSVDDRVDTITEVNRLVLQKFRAAGIEIAFPQRDVNFDSKQPLAIRLIEHENKTP